MQHTPEPWHVSTDIARGKTRCLILTSCGDEIAQVNHNRSEFTQDAQLLASAPDLLQACEAALNEVGLFSDAIVKVLADAVAKAKD